MASGKNTKKKKVDAKQTEAGKCECREPVRVSLASCAGGMFLCLVLGLYIGSMIPGIIAGLDTKGPVQDSLSPGSLPAVEKMQPANPGKAVLDAKIGILEKKAAADPQNPANWTELGNFYFDSNMYENAIHAYEHSLALKPDNADVLTDLGIMYRQTGEFNKALECFRKAVVVNPKHVNALYNEGVVLATDLGDRAGAEMAWRRLLEISPDAHAPDGQPVSDMIKNLH